MAVDHVLQWLSLALRWTHVITGIAWIGTSFYFNWLNSRIGAPQQAEPGVAGDLWSVHGGGFYRMVKYTVAPARLPETLHWFKWEAYFTWVTGAALLVLIYYLQANIYLVDPAVADIGTGVAIAIGVGTLFAGWWVYDLLCKSPLGKRPVALVIVGFILATLVSYGLTRVLSSRAAYIHVGALIGTIMANNVFQVIIPSQQQMVEAMKQGQPPNANVGKQAALRSLHNNYLTLPVLFIMVSNHYPVTYGHAWNWAILAAISVIGAGIRHWFNLRNQGRRSVWILPAAAVGMLVLAYVTAGGRYGGRVVVGGAGGATGAPGPRFADVRVVIAQRCAPCHSSTPTEPAFPSPPLGVALDTPEQIRTQAQRIYDVTIATRLMPLGNLTGMTDEERELLGNWIREGARLRD